MKKFWLGVAFGALAGGFATLFLAPHSGRSTRRKVKHSLDDLGDSLLEAAEYMKDQAERLSKEANKLLNSGKGPIGDVVDAAQQYAQLAGKYAKSASSKLEEQASRLM